MLVCIADYISPYGTTLGEVPQSSCLWNKCVHTYPHCLVPLFSLPLSYPRISCTYVLPYHLCNLIRSLLLVPNLIWLVSTLTPHRKSWYNFHQISIGFVVCEQEWRRDLPTGLVQMTHDHWFVIINWVMTWWVHEFFCLLIPDYFILI